MSIDYSPFSHLKGTSYVTQTVVPWKPKLNYYYSVQAVCRSLGVSKSFILARIRSGKLPAMNTGGRYRIELKDYKRLCKDLEFIVGVERSKKRQRGRGRTP